MSASLSIDTFEPLAWVNDYTRASPPVNAAEFEPILQFSLLWNLFERDACRKNANPKAIKRAVSEAFAEGKLSLSSFQEHLIYFRDRSQRDGMTIPRYLEALKISDASDRQLVQGVLSSSLDDPSSSIYALLLIANRIRNNLFHGEKKVVLLRSQIDLFRAINSLIATYLSVTKSMV